jgi:hypothetical protein
MQGADAAASSSLLRSLQKLYRGGNEWGSSPI